MPAIELRQISHHYPGRIRALQDVSLPIPDGSLTTIMGPSGCGKTTLLRIIAGLERPTHGQVWFDDRDVTGIAPAERDVAATFQDAALYPHMTVRKNLRFAPRLRRVERAVIDDRVAHAAELLDIHDLLDRRPHALSAGERQRTALARCLVRRPAVMLLDEPLANLDVHLRARLRHDIRLVHAQLKCTTIYVTHAWNEAQALADQLVVLAGGRMQQFGIPEQVLKFPASAHVAQVVGEMPMNLIAMHAQRTGDGSIELTESEVSLSDQIETEDAMGTSNGRLVLNLGSLPDLHLPTERVLLGVSPDAVNMHAAGDSNSEDTLHLRLTVQSVSGSDIAAISPAGGRLMFAYRTSDTPLPRAGDPIAVSLLRDHARVFDQDTGRRIWPVDAPLVDADRIQ